MSATLLEILPRVNALLNATCAVLLFTGRARIRAGERLRHSRFMVAAFVTSAVFLASYLTRVLLAKGTTHFVGSLRGVYLVLLATHTLAAVVVLPFILRTLYLALNKRFAEHRKVARWTYPLWMYVSVTGVLVYVMLYHLADARIHGSI